MNDNIIAAIPKNGAWSIKYIFDLTNYEIQYCLAHKPNRQELCPNKFKVCLNKLYAKQIKFQGIYNYRKGKLSVFLPKSTLSKIKLYSIAAKDVNITTIVYQNGLIELKTNLYIKASDNEKLKALAFNELKSIRKSKLELVKDKISKSKNPTYNQWVDL